MLRFILFLILSKFILVSIFADETKTLNSKDLLSKSVLHNAIRSKDFKLIKFLIDKKVNINEKDQFGYTPLHLAVRYSDVNTTKLLIDNNVTIDSIDNYGETPLIDAVRNNDTSIAKLLICKKANRNIVDLNGISTLNYVTKNKNLYLTKLLTTDYTELYCQDKIKVSISPKKKLFSKNIEICGKIDLGYVSDITLSLTGDDNIKYGPYGAKIDNKKHTWCSKIDDKLPLGKYKVDIKAQDYVVNTATVSTNKIVTKEIKK